MQDYISLLPRLSYIIFNRPVVRKTTLLRQKSQQTHYLYFGNAESIIITDLQLNLQKHITMCNCNFNKISIKKKNRAA